MKYALLGLFFCLAYNHALAQVRGVSINFNDYYGQTTDGTLGPLTGTSIAYSLNTSGANESQA